MAWNDKDLPSPPPQKEKRAGENRVEVHKQWRTLLPWIVPTLGYTFGVLFMACGFY